MSKAPKITPKNIMNFIEGNLNMLGDKLETLPKHFKEQVIWRLSKCKDDCVVNKSCIYCGCSVPGKLYVKESCNGGERFPDIMDKENWESYKRINKIRVNG